MKAFILDGYGSADRVRAGDVADPELRENDVLVQIHAAGVNLLDSKIRTGEFKLILRYRLPLILGHDVAGVVVRVGSRVRRFKPGDEARRRELFGIARPRAAYEGYQGRGHRAGVHEDAIRHEPAGAQLEAR